MSAHTTSDEACAWHVAQAVRELAKWAPGGDELSRLIADAVFVRASPEWWMFAEEVRQTLLDLYVFAFEKHEKAVQAGSERATPSRFYAAESAREAWSLARANMRLERVLEDLGALAYSSTAIALARILSLAEECGRNCMEGER